MKPLEVWTCQRPENLKKKSSKIPKNNYAAKMVSAARRQIIGGGGGGGAPAHKRRRGRAAPIGGGGAAGAQLYARTRTNSNLNVSSTGRRLESLENSEHVLRKIHHCTFRAKVSERPFYPYLFNLFSHLPQPQTLENCRSQKSAAAARRGVGGQKYLFKDSRKISF